MHGGPRVVRQPPSVFLNVAPGPVQVLPADPEGEGVVSLSPGARVPRAAPAQDGHWLLRAAARVLQDAPCVGLSLPRCRHRGQVGVLAEADAPPIAPAGHVTPGAGGHRVSVGLPASGQPVPGAGGRRCLPGAAPVSGPSTCARPPGPSIPVPLRGRRPVSVGVLVSFAAKPSVSVNVNSHCDNRSCWDHHSPIAHTLPPVPRQVAGGVDGHVAPGVPGVIAGAGVASRHVPQPHWSQCCH